MKPMIRITQMMEQVPPKSHWRDGLTIEDKDALASADCLEPLLSPDGTQIGWYDPVTNLDYPY